MIHLVVPFVESRRLPFYLAMEEWAALTLPAGEYFFSWRVSPTVICGRNQEIDKEVDLGYCRSHGIDVVRRKSGGGCVYANMDNFMFSYVCPGDEITTTFARYTMLIANQLRALGFDASATGRNDVLIGGRKVAGNAFYHLPGRCISHGTMLYDLDSDTMGKAITPSRAKLESKSVKSVQSRVTCLKAEGIQLTPEEFESYMINAMCDCEIHLTKDDVAAIEEIEKGYYLPEFLYRKGEVAPAARISGIVRSARVEGVGEMQFFILADKAGRISRIECTGDFFILDDPEKHIFRHLRGIRLYRNEIEYSLRGVSPEKSIAGLTREALADVLTGDAR